VDDNFRNKKITELTGQDLSNVLREGSWYSDYSQEVFKKYIGVEDFGDILFSALNISFANSLIYRFILEDFFEENNLKIEAVAQPGHSSNYAPTYANIEYEQKKYKSCLQLGVYFLSTPHGDRYIFGVEPRHNDVSFSCSSSKKALPNSQAILDALTVYAEKKNFLKGKKIDASCNFIYFDKQYTWNDLILSNELQNEIRRNLSNLIEHREIYQKNNLTVKRGLIFSGPPGTGKSLLGKILCQTTDWTFVWVTPKHIGKPDDIAKIVSVCRDLSPTILFLEDVDLFSGDRGGNSDNSVLGELMNQLDGIQENTDIITIATTNRAEVIEKALIDRPGRFDKVIEFSIPDESIRAKLLKYFIKDLHLDAEVDITVLSKLTNGLAGAHIRELVNLAVLTAIDEGSFDNNKLIHFRVALASVKKKDFSKLGFGISKLNSEFHDYLLEDPL
jgi:hypothetical protein